MISLLWLIPALPFASASVLVLFGSRLSRRASAVVGVGSIGLAALITILVALSFFSAPPSGSSYTQVLWTWINVAGFQPEIGFYLDRAVAGDGAGGHVRRLFDSPLLGRVHD